MTDEPTLAKRTSKSIIICFDCKKETNTSYFVYRKGKIREICQDCKKGGN